MHIRTIRTLSFALLATAAAAARAQTDPNTYYWVGNAGATNWGTAGNWTRTDTGTDTVVPTQTSFLTRLIFNRDADGGINNNLVGLFRLRELQLNNQSYNLTGNNSTGTPGVLGFAGGGILRSSVGASTIAMNVFLNNDGRTSGDQSLAVQVDSGSLALTGLVSGTGSLVKNGAGTLALTRADNNWSLGTVVNAGTLLLGATNALPSGGSLNTQAGAIVDLSPTAATAPAGVTPGAYDQSIGSLTGAGTLRLGGATLSVGQNSGNSTFAGTITGAGKLVKIGTNSLTLSGIGGQTGGTTINAGRLVMGSNNALGGVNGASAGDLLLQNGSLDLNGYSPTVKNLLFGDGFVSTGTVTGSGVLNLAGDLVENRVASSPTLQLTVNLALTAGEHRLLFSNYTPVNGRPYDLVLNGAISGPGGLTKGDGQTVALTGANTYTGATRISNGFLFLGAANTLPSTTALTIDAGATASQYLYTARPGVTIGSYAQTISSLSGAGTYEMGSANLTVGDATSTTFSGTIEGEGRLIKQGAGTLTLTGANDYDGTTIGAGRLVVAQPSGDYLNNATLEIANPDARTLAGTVSGSGAFVKSGAGVLTLTGQNGYTGTTSLTAGTLALGAANALPTTTTLLTSAGSTLDLKGFDQTVGSISGAGAIVIGSGTLTAGNAASTTYSGVISGNGGLTKEGTGTLTLQRANTYSGTTSVNVGTLTFFRSNAYSAASLLLLGSGGTLDLGGYNQTVGGLSGSGAVRLGAAALTVGGSGTNAYSGTITGPGSVTQQGSGTLLLTGSNTYAGGTSVAAGTLQVGANGALPSGGTVTMLGGTLDLNGFSPTVGALNFGNGQATSVGTVSGAGTLNLLGDITFSGAVRFFQGGYNFTTAGGAVSSDIALSTGNHSVGFVGNRDSTDLYDLIFSGAISGAGGLTFNGQRFDTNVVLSGPSTYAGATTVSGGNLYLGAANALPSTTALTVAAGAELDMTVLFGDQGIMAGSYAQTVGALSGAGTIFIGDTTFKVGNGNASSAFSGQFIRYNTSGAGLLEKVGNGRLDLTAANFSLGPALRIDAGTVAVTTSNLPSTTLAGGTLELSQNVAGTLDGNRVTGTGSLLKSGTGTVTVIGSLGSDVSPTIAVGILKGAPSAFTHAVVGAAGATLQIDASAPGILAAGYSGAGDFLKTGNGQVLLTSVLSNTGATTVQAGSLDATAAGSFGGLSLAGGARFINDSAGTVRFTRPVVTQGEFATLGGSTTVFDGVVSGAGGFSGFGEVDFEGGYNPGNSPARVTFQSFVGFGANNRLQMELAGTMGGSRTNPATQYDQLDFTRGARLNGALDIVYYGGFVAGAGESFDLFDWNDPFTGAFSSIALPALGDGLAWDTSRLYTTGVVSVQAVPEPSAFVALGLGLAALMRRRRK